MAEDNENKRSFLEKLGDAGGGILNVAGRVGEGVVDGLAESRPLIGRPLQYGLSAAGFNTEGYQDRQDQRSARKEALLAARNRNQEWDANAPVREEERKAKLELLDARRKSMYISQFSNNLNEDFTGNPQYEMMSLPERKAYINSPAVQALFEKKYYLQEVMDIAKNDKSAFARMDRVFRNAKMRLRMPEKKGGIAYLELPNGESLPATQESIDRIDQMVSMGALEELNARSMIADASTMGNPAKRSMANRVKTLMPYNNNDATGSFKMVKGIFDKASEEEKGWHLFNQAISDYKSSGLPTKAKMNGLAACLPFLQKMGYAVEGFDPKNPNVDAITVIDLNNKTKMSFSEFAERCKNNDTLGRRLDERIGMAQWSYLMQQSGKTFANASVRGAMPKSGSGKSAKNVPEEKPDPDTVTHQDLAKAFGDYYSQLPEKKRSALIHAKREWDATRDDILKEYGASSVIELPDKAVQKLEDDWNMRIGKAGLKTQTFYSPVNSMIRQRDIQSLEAEIKKREAAIGAPNQKSIIWDNFEDPKPIFLINARDRVRSRNGKKIREHQKVLKQRGKIR